MIRWSKPTESDLVEVAIAAASASPTHPASGSFAHFQHSGTVGQGQAGFEAGRRMIRSWKMHEDAGVCATPVPMAVGNDVIMWTKAVGLTLVFACRIVEVVDDDHAFGFTYATLPGHPAQGVETFRLERHDDTVHIHISGESRPALWLHKLSGPIGLRMQRQATERYITALRAGIASAGG